MPASLAQIDEKNKENNTTCNGDAQWIRPGRALGSEPDEPDKEPSLTRNDKFTFSHTQLDELFNEKSLSAYRALGGLTGLERGLRTDRRSGLSMDETTLNGGAVSTRAGRVGGPSDEPFADRKHAFGDNTMPRKKSLSMLRLMWMAYNDQVLFLLTAAAIVSLAIGLYQTFGTVAPATNSRVEYVEGVAIIIAIIIILLVGAANDWERERQFAKLNKKKQDRDVKIVRSGKFQMISISNVLVGDVVHFEPGDVIPADGIFIEGYNVTCDESSTTGESMLIRKHPGEEVFRATRKQEQEDAHGMDPFMISGTNVVEGVGTFLVTATGVNSSHGRILMSLHDSPSFTPLQEKLKDVVKFIAKLGAVAALLLFAVLFIKVLIQLPHQIDTTLVEKGQKSLNILIVSITVLVIAVPEGLPLAVTLALAFANKMLKDHNLVRQLKACETMGNATSICSDKTGTLIQNKMTVVSEAFGTDLQVDETYKVEVDGQQTFIGSQTEAALLTFARTYLDKFLDPYRTPMECIVSVQAQKSRAQAFGDVDKEEVRIFEIPGLLAKHSTKALGDYGARKNFIKEEFAKRLGLPIDRALVCKVTVGNGKLVKTTGVVTAPFRFKGEHHVHHLKFHILPDCIHNVILGKSFLKLTETLSKLSNFHRRVKERVVKGISQFHLLYLGASSPMFEGFINGRPQTALADSGAKVLVMDEAYALRTGVSIQTGYEHRTRLKFVDNSTADTSGMAYNVEWRFGRDGEFTSPYRLNFHILKNAPADVILCDTFLYDNEAFSRYHHYLLDNDDDSKDEDDESHCFAIDVDRRKKRLQTPPIASSLADLQYLELVRRGKEEDHISALPVSEQPAAKNIEKQQCAEWDRTFAALQANIKAQSLQQPSTTATSPLQSTQPAHSSTTRPQDSNSSPTGERRWLKWPTQLKRRQLTTSTRR